MRESRAHFSLFFRPPRQKVEKRGPGEEEAEEEEEEEEKRAPFRKQKN